MREIKNLLSWWRTLDGVEKASIDNIQHLVHTGNWDACAVVKPRHNKKFCMTCTVAPEFPKYEVLRATQ